MSDDDESTSDSSSSDSEPAPSGEGSASVEGSEPPPAGDDTEPAPAGETSSSDDPSDKPLEDNEGHSDSSAETEGCSSSESSSRSSSSDSSDSSSSSDSSDSSSSDSSGGKSVQPPSADDVAGALTGAFHDHSVPMDDDTVNVTGDSNYYKLAVRLSSSFDPLPKVHDDTQSLQTGSLQGALYMINGAVQVIEDQVKVTMRIVSVETSEILQVSSGSGSGSVLDAIRGAAGDALAGLPALNAT